MLLPDAALALIKAFEGLRLRPYVCPAGYWTIGYGHVLSPAEKEKYREISPNEAELLLVEDAQRTERAVRRLILVPLTENELAALISFTFSLGSGALQRSTLRQMLNRDEDREEVAEQFLRWVFAAGRKLQGLVRRRQSEGLVFLGKRINFL
jgi:lysozyme